LANVSQINAALKPKRIDAFAKKNQKQNQSSSEENIDLKKLVFETKKKTMLH
jgi:hypothetical protein